MFKYIYAILIQTRVKILHWTRLFMITILKQNTQVFGETTYNENLEINYLDG